MRCVWPLALTSSTSEPWRSRNVFESLPPTLSRAEALVLPEPSATTWNSGYTPEVRTSVDSTLSVQAHRAGRTNRVQRFIAKVLSRRARCSPHRTHASTQGTCHAPPNGLTRAVASEMRLAAGCRHD